MNYHAILQKGKNILKKNNIQSPHLDAELILSKVTNKKREEILLNINNKLNNVHLRKFRNYLLRRKQKEPMAYILGYKHFWKYKFFTNNSVLIPRPDTELIVEETLKYIPINQSKKILDVGTGSGCIVISLLKDRPKISNPPYINSIDLNRLDDDIKFHEPRLALSGGSDGFRDLKKVIKKSRELLKINGKLILEIGSGQKDKVIRLLNKYCYYVNTVSKDLSGNDRCIISTKLK